jgi:hypothetical protein
VAKTAASNPSDFELKMKTLGGEQEEMVGLEA